MTQLLFTVIIPTCNRCEALAQCLDCLAPEKQQNFTYFTPACIDEKNYQVIVADDSSSTETRSMLKNYYPWVYYVAGPKQGPAANRNEGAKHAQGAWLVFTDDDCLPEQNWLWAYYQAMQSHKALAYEGRIEPLTPLKGDLWKCPVNTHGGNFWSANIALNKALFDQVSGFDKKFPYPAYEDTDLYNRISIITDVPFVPQAVIYHPINYFTLAASISKEMKVIHSRAYLFAKNNVNEKPWKKFKTLALEFKIYLKQLLRNSLHGHIKSATLYMLLLVLGMPTLSYLYFKYNRLLTNETKA